ncbi:hypothetical protein [Bavariicoccus seileri]|uniref:hypothetical protein n=1 Tax=Bavariicoccus seileri TaxID=549685 RepID=UPI0003B49011|nr:hypothetical protein [Bavariicoccus seileri]
MRRRKLLPIIVIILIAILGGAVYLQRQHTAATTFTGKITHLDSAGEEASVTLTVIKAGENVAGLAPDSDVVIPNIGDFVEPSELSEGKVLSVRLEKNAIMTMSYPPIIPGNSIVKITVTNTIID